MGNRKQLEAQADALLKEAGFADLAVYKDIAPPSDALAHAERIGLIHDFLDQADAA